MASASRAFAGFCALAFAATAAITVAWSGSMSAMAGMPMPGGWTMSMTWMRMPGTTWPGAAAAFLGMWMVMMIAMMLPSLSPALWRYRQGLAQRRRSRRLIALVAAGYFAVWGALGLIAYAIGMLIAEAEMQVPALARVAPTATGLVVLLAGALQFTSWKARHLACCRGATPACGTRTPPIAAAAWRHGVRLGWHCGCCCAGPMAALLAVGVMDVFAMALVTAAITAERLAPASDRSVRAVGAVGLGLGLLLLARAAGLH